MRRLLFFALLTLFCCLTAIQGQPARTAAAYQPAPFSQLLSTLPDGQVRNCINCSSNASTGTCESGASQMVATKLNGTWKCSNGAGGGGGGGVTSFNSRTGLVIPALNDYTFSQIGNVAQNKLLGRGATSGAGVIQEITIGSGLTLTGTTLTGTGNGSGTAGKIPKWATPSTLNDSNIQDTGTALTLGVNSSVTGTLSSSGAISTLQSVTGGGSSFFNFSARSLISSPADGQLLVTNAAVTDFTRLYFGTTSLPYIQVSTGAGNFLFNDTSGGGTATVTAGQFVSGPSSTAGGANGFKSVDVDGSVTIVAPDNAGIPYTPWTLTLPPVNGNAGEFLQTNGTGVTTWAVPAGGGDVLASGTLTSNKILKGGGTTVVAASTVTITQPTTAGSFIFGTDNADLTFQGDGTVVNRDSTDTLINKSISGSTNTFTNIPLATAVTGNLSVNNLNGGTGASGTTAWFGDGTWKSGIGTFSSNTVTSVDSEFVLFSGTGGQTGKRATGTGVAISTSGVFSVKTNPLGAFVGDTDAQTLINKTLTTPTIASFANATHNHTNSAGGGLLTITSFSSSSGSGAVLGQGSPTITTPTIADLSNVQHNHNSTASGGSLTSPKVVTGINDTNGNELLKVTATASAVNELTLANAATGAGPTLSATGSDTDININLVPKGAGGVSMGTAGVASLITIFNAASDAATISTDTVDIVKVGKAVQLTTGTKPTCASGVRGTIWYTAGGVGVSDVLELCAHKSDNTYAWISMVTVP